MVQTFELKIILVVYRMVYPKKQGFIWYGFGGKVNTTNIHTHKHTTIFSLTQPERNGCGHRYDQCCSRSHDVSTCNDFDVYAKGFVLSTGFFLAFRLICPQECSLFGGGGC